MMINRSNVNDQISQMLENAVSNAAKRRIPKQRPLFLLAHDFGAVLLGLPQGAVNAQNFDQVKRIANDLDRAAELYYRLADLEATSPRRRGRPKLIADTGFIYAMANVFSLLVGTYEFGYRSYDSNGRERVGNGKGGIERPTIFQGLCHSWMKHVDPERAKPLGIAAFKNAKRWRNERGVE